MLRMWSFLDFLASDFLASSIPAIFISVSCYWYSFDCQIMVPLLIFSPDNICLYRMRFYWIFLPLSIGISLILSCHFLSTCGESCGVSSTHVPTRFFTAIVFVVSILCNIPLYYDGLASMLSLISSRPIITVCYTGVVATLGYLLVMRRWANSTWTCFETMSPYLRIQRSCLLMASLFLLLGWFYNGQEGLTTWVSVGATLGVGLGNTVNKREHAQTV